MRIGQDGRMQLSPEAIKEFKTIYRKEYGVARGAVSDHQSIINHIDAKIKGDTVMVQL